MKNQKGRNSLIICIIGLIIVQTLIYFNYLDSYWCIVLAGFEAGTVGGIADWFAVKALFREIPIPIVRKHTNIIVKNRGKISLGIVDLVTNEWLSPKVIHEKIAEIEITEKLLNSVNSTQITPFLKQITHHFTSNLENDKLHKFLLKTVTTQFQKLKLGIHLGKFLKDAIGGEEHQQLWKLGLDSAEKAVNTPETKDLIKNALEAQSEKYKNESTLKGWILSLGEGSKAVDYNSISEKLINVINEIIEKAKNDPNDALRKNVDNSLNLFAENLINEDEKSTKIINALKEKLTSTDTNGIVNKLISNFKEMISNKLNNDSKLDVFLEKQVEQFLEKLKANKNLQVKIDEFLKNAIEKLITKNHHEIGKMVETSLANLDDEDLVNQIEDKVGDDLQYIRLNGAIVGGFVGVVIAVLRMTLGLM